MVAGDIPTNMEGLVAEKRHELIETVSEVDDKLAEFFLSDEPVSSTDLDVSQYISVLAYLTLNFSTASNCFSLCQILHSCRIFSALAMLFPPFDLISDSGYYTDEHCCGH